MAEIYKLTIAALVALNLFFAGLYVIERQYAESLKFDLDVIKRMADWCESKRKGGKG